MLASHRAPDERPISTSILEALEGRLLLCSDHAAHLAADGVAADFGPALAVQTAPDAKRAVAVLTSAAGMNVSGTVEFKRVKGGVEVKVDVRGLTPGLHGFHVHAGAVCTPDDGFNSALGHFNPTNEPHGAPTAVLHHDGDMGNLVADKKGRAKAHIFLKDVTVGGADGFVGHTVIIHANPDDLVTQPTGNSGPRVACGLIQAVRKGHGDDDHHGHDDDDDDQGHGHGGDQQGPRCLVRAFAEVFSKHKSDFAELFD